MKRRQFLATASAIALAAPNVVRAQSASKILKFIPESDVTVLDPVWTTATVTHHHGYAVFDTLYGQDDSFAIQLEMLAGQNVENDGRLWRLTLRDGLKFHDGTPVLGRDVVASIKRFAARDAFGRALMDATDELSAASDKEIQFRLKQPFPLLPNALGKSGTAMPAIMPERLASTDPNKAITEMVGSGPFRFNTKERVVGASVIYDKFEGYVPRADGVPSFSAGPKSVYYDRIEWHIIPDAATAASAVINGEVDWWQQPDADLLPQFAAKKYLVVAPQDPAGATGVMRFNHLHPPFNNPAIRRALLGAINQEEYMLASGGEDRSLWKTDVGCFSPGTPMANSAGIEILHGKRDFDAVAKAVKAAGYDGSPIVVLGATDQHSQYAQTLVGVDMLKRVGFNVDFVSTDWGTVVQRRANKAAPDKGGWNIFFTSLNGTNNFDPASHLGLRGNGAGAWFGWPTAPRLEELRLEWFAARNLDEQKRVCVEIQKQFWIDVPYIPLGTIYQPAVYNRKITGVRSGFPQFYNVRPA